MTRRSTTVVIGPPDMGAAEECPTCGFDALLLFPLTMMNASGVGPFGTYRACARCADAENADDAN